MRMEYRCAWSGPLKNQKRGAEGRPSLGPRAGRDQYPAAGRSQLAKGKRNRCDIITGNQRNTPEHMTKPAPAIQPIELDCADDGLALQMTRWLAHLRSERRLSPKTLEAYARDVRQCLAFLCEHWGTPVTLSRF